jgi:hypothetical protein
MHAQTFIGFHKKRLVIVWIYQDGCVLTGQFDGEDGAKRLETVSEQLLAILHKLKCMTEDRRPSQHWWCGFHRSSL